MEHDIETLQGRRQGGHVPTFHHRVQLFSGTVHGRDNQLELRWQLRAFVWIRLVLVVFLSGNEQWNSQQQQAQDSNDSLQYTHHRLPYVISSCNVMCPNPSMPK